MSMTARLASALWIGVFVAGLVVFLLGCQSGQEAQDPSAEDTASTDRSIAIDSLTQPPPPAPAPGTAHVRGRVQSCESGSESNSESLRCQLRIDAVLKYGSATPVLGTGPKPVEVAGGTAQQWTPRLLQAVGETVFVLRHKGERMPDSASRSEDATPTDRSPEWTIISVQDPASPDGDSR